MNKKIRITIIVITILFILLIGGIVLIIKNNQKKELEFNQNIYNNFVEKIEQKDTFLLYLNNSDEECFLCDDVNNMVDYYKEVYDLDIYTIDELNMMKEYYQNIIKYIDNRLDYYKTPAIILIKDGKAVAAVSEIIFEDALRQFLIEKKFIEEEDNEILIDKVSTEKLENNSLDDYLYQDKNNLVIVYNYSKYSYDFRKEIRSLSKEYDFSYLLSFFGRGNYNEDYYKLLKLIGKKIRDESNRLPTMFVVNNGKVIDYTSTLNEKEIKKFLEKNEIIK